MNERNRIDLKALGLQQLEAFASSLGEPRFRGMQLFRWLHGRGAQAFAEMTDLPLALRERLFEHARIAGIEPVTLQTALDHTVKGLFRLESGRPIESVLIPDFDDEGNVRRLTVCVSSQVGCAMGCAFCATGLMGFQQNLTAGEIVDQVRFMDTLALQRFGRSVTNVVYMGMGEPLLNYDAVLESTRILAHEAALGLSPKRITVSTVGLAPRIRQLADDGAPFRLAVSLHAPTDEKRSRIMPVNRSGRTDLDALRDALEHYYDVLRQPVTYEYCLFAGVNDSDGDAEQLARVVRWIPSKVNLIMYNPVPELSFGSSSEARLHRFIRALVARDVSVTVRRSRGQDIDAACGQLAARKGRSAEEGMVEKT